MKNALNAYLVEEFWPREDVCKKKKWDIKSVVDVVKHAFRAGWKFREKEWEKGLGKAIDDSIYEKGLKGSVREFERTIIVDALRRSNGSAAQAARLLKTTTRIITYKIQQYGIQKTAN